MQNRKDFQQSSLFQYFAVQIQRSFRGYYSRKYLSDHSSRRAYFKSIADKNQEVLDMMAEYALVQISVRSFECKRIFECRGEIETKVICTFLCSMYSLVALSIASHFDDKISFFCPLFPACLVEYHL